MEFYSTKNKNTFFSLEHAVLKGLADDKGLFMPRFFPRLSDRFFMHAPSMGLSDIAYEIAHVLLSDSLESPILKKIIEETIVFDAPLVQVSEKIFSLELFHGPTLAFKDFGARFMAALMSHFTGNNSRKLTILVATSGDTGGAVANGFYNKEAIDVIILYPSGKVSTLQEKQLTTLGQNITALEINGSFDDCQRIVKAAFLDEDIKTRYWLSSANSINISRLIPQSFYYVYAWSRISQKKLPVVFSVPSGNFGNLTAGLFVKKMGTPIQHFIAATNVNDCIPTYLETGIFNPSSSKHTLSNAMDVGDPSNFQRMLDLYNGEAVKMRADISGFVVNDQQTIETILRIKKSDNYLLDPHGAVAFLALENYIKQNQQVNGVFLETAHPAKFLETMEEITGDHLELPQPLKNIEAKVGKSIKLSHGFSDFKNYLLETRPIS